MGDEDMWMWVSVVCEPVGTWVGVDKEEHGGKCVRMCVWGD